MNWEDWPPMSTQPIGFQIDGAVVELHPPTLPDQLVEIAGAPTPPTFVLGPPITVNQGDVFPAGWWILTVAVPISDTEATAGSTLIEATGITTAPTAGTAYSLSVV